MTFYRIVPLKETVGIQRSPQWLPDSPGVAYNRGIEFLVVAYNQGVNSPVVAYNRGVDSPVVAYNQGVNSPVVAYTRGVWLPGCNTPSGINFFNIFN